MEEQYAPSKEEKARFRALEHYQVLNIESEIAFDRIVVSACSKGSTGRKQGGVIL